MDFPSPYQTPTHINTYMSLCAGRMGRAGTMTGLTSQTWALANLAIFYPLILPWPYPVQRAFWINGTVVAGNVDIGIYTQGGARLWSAGSTAQSGTSAPQYVTGPGTMLSPGYYYIGLSHDSVTGTHYGFALANATARITGIMQAASALPLPNPVTYAAYAQTTGPTISVCGITRTASGF